MSDDSEDTEIGMPAEEQHGRKRTNSEINSDAESDSSQHVKKILKDFSYESFRDEPVSPLNKTDDKLYVERADSDSSSVIFVAQLREPDPTQGPSNSFGASSSYDREKTPAEKNLEALTAVYKKVNAWLTDEHHQIGNLRCKTIYHQRTGEYDFEDLSESMFEWLLKVSEEYDAKKKKNCNVTSVAGSSDQNENADETAMGSGSSVNSGVEKQVQPNAGEASSQPAQEECLDSDIIEISDDENQEELADDGENANEYEREETEAESETDSREINNNDIESPRTNSNEKSQDEENETDNENPEDDAQDDLENDLNEDAEDDGENPDPNSELPEIEYSAESLLQVNIPNVDEQSAEVFEWFVQK